MKIPRLFLLPYPTLIAIVINIVLLGWVILAFTQVTIPASSESSLDDAPTPPSTTGIPQASRSPFNNSSSISRTAPSGPSKVTLSNVPALDPKSVAAVQKVPTPTQNLDPAKIRRLSELRRELNISEAATQARLALPSEDIFESTAPETIDDLSEPTLKKVLEFIELNDKKNVTVKAFYVPEQENGKNLAWARSLSLIEWMTKNSTLRLENIKAESPGPVLKPTPKKVAKNSGEAEFVGRIELLLEFKNSEITQ